MDHDVNEYVDNVNSSGPATWYVWRRDDGFVGISNVEPTEAFTADYAYYTLLVTRDYEHAAFEAMQARLCN